MKKLECHMCSTLLEKDHIALNRKLLGRQVDEFFCIDCLAEHFDCPKDDLLIKIEEFKEQGCGLFR
jgi:hypothetical protein